MKRILLWFISTLSAVVLLFSYKTSLAGPQTASAISSPSPVIANAPSSTGSSSAASATPSATTSTTSTPSRARTVTGASVETRYGPVQVQVSVAGGRITSVQVLEYPSGNGRDAQINSYALPVLENETMTAQSAKIDMVSGATYTSDGYVSSLQSALDQAGV